MEGIDRQRVAVKREMGGKRGSRGVKEGKG